MSEYKSLGQVCKAVRWLASECDLNRTAADCEGGLDTLIAAMPDDDRTDWDQDQVDFFRQCYENPSMRAVMTGTDEDGERVENTGFWPTYDAEQALGNIVWVGNPTSNPWA